MRQKNYFYCIHITKPNSFVYDFSCVIKVLIHKMIILLSLQQVEVGYGDAAQDGAGDA